MELMHGHIRITHLLNLVQKLCCILRMGAVSWMIHMDRNCIEELSTVHLLIADTFIKQMIPDEYAAAEYLPDEDLLICRWVYTELHASGSALSSIMILSLRIASKAIPNPWK